MANHAIVLNQAKNIKHNFYINNKKYIINNNSTILSNLKKYYSNYYFYNWYYDKQFKKRCDLNEKIKTDIHLYTNDFSKNINCDYQIEVDNIIGYKGKFIFKKDIQVFSPSYGTYANSNCLNYINYTFIIVDYNIKNNNYYVKDIISKGIKRNIIIPYKGFIICVYNKSIHNNIHIDDKVSLNRYSVNKSKYIYFNEKYNKINNELLMGNRYYNEFVSVYDSNNNKIIYNFNGDKLAYPASTTKIVTAIVALKYARLEDTLIIGDTIDITFEGSEPSTAGIKKGQVWNLRQLLYAMLLPSGNDAAYCVADLTINTIYKENNFFPKKKIDLFITLMNEELKECNSINSHFMSPDGNSYYNNDESWNERITKHYITANDMIKIANYAFHIPELSDIVQTQKINFNILSKEKYNFISTNSFLDIKSQYFYDGVVGMKTGTTNPAGCCLVSGIECNNNFYIVSMFNTKTSKDRYFRTSEIYDCIKKTSMK